MSNIHAQFILRSLDCYWVNKTERERQIDYLDAACPAEWRMPPRQAPWVYDIRIPGLTKQDAVVQGLNGIGILARHCFKPCAMQEEYLDYRCIGGCEQSLLASREVIYLGLQPHLSRIDQIVFKEIDRVLQQ